MTHSIFTDVIKIGCTDGDAKKYAKSLSAKVPGYYELFFSLACDNSYQIEKQLKAYFNANKYVNEFYQVDPEIAKKLLKREALKIPLSASVK